MSGELDFEDAGSARAMTVTGGPVVTFAQLRSDISRQRRWVLLITLLGLVAGVGGWFLTPTTYTATAVVSLYSLPDSPLQAGAPQRVNAATERQVGQSSEVVAALAAHLPRTPQQIRDSLAVEVPMDSAALRFSYTDENPEVAADAADAAATAYLELRNTAYQETIDSAVERTDQQLQELEGRQLALAEEVAAAAGPITAARAQQSYDQASILLGQLRAQRSELQTGSLVGGRLVSPAGVPTGPNGLALPGWMVAGLGLGLLLGCAFAVTRGQLDRRIHTRAHLEAATGLRTLADLSMPGQDLERAAALLLARHRTDPVSPLVLAGCAVTHGQGIGLELAAHLRHYGATVKLLGADDLPEILDGAEIHLVDAILASEGEALFRGSAGTSVVLVAQQAVTRFDDLTELRGELQRLGVPVLGTILLDSDAGRAAGNREPKNQPIAAPQQPHRAALDEPGADADGDAVQAAAPDGAEEPAPSRAGVSRA